MPTADIITPPAFRGPPSVRLDRPRRDMPLAAVAAALGIAGLTPRSIVSTIRQLIDRDGFPLPRTVRMVRGRRVVGSQAVTVRSVWNADEVAAWLDKGVPPAGALGRDALARDHARVDMARRAQMVANL